MSKRKADQDLEEVKKEDTDFLECGICFEWYTTTEKKPLNLNCGHTYCKACVSHIILKKQIEGILCPDCRRPQFFQNIEDLPVNYPLQKMLSQPEIKENPKCSSHPTFTCDVYCIDC